MSDIAANRPLSTRAVDHPVNVDLDAPLEIARWRPLVHWILVVPHFIVFGLLNVGAAVCIFIAFWAILFTKKYPEGLFNFVAMTYRYQWRLNSYAWFMRETYPPFAFDLAAEDPGGDPAKLSIPYPQELNRFLPLVKFILVIPHVFVLGVLFIGVWFAGLGSFFAVLFTGKYPQGIRDFIVGVMRYGSRVQAYMTLMRDEYPPFSWK